MQPQDRDAGFLWDIRETARETLTFTGATSYEQFAGNTVLRYAVEQQLAVIGEAARQVSTSFRQAHPEIDWDALVSRRNLIIHDYGEITAQRLWNVVHRELPRLVAAIEPLIPPAPSS